MFNESYWFEPTRIALALTRVEKVERGFRLELETPNGIARYRLAPTPGGAQLQREGVAPGVKAKAIALKRVDPAIRTGDR